MKWNKARSHLRTVPDPCPHALWLPLWTNLCLGGWGWKWDLGAFIAGVPVQPVLIRYPNSLVSLGLREGHEGA